MWLAKGRQVHLMTFSLHNIYLIAPISRYKKYSYIPFHPQSTYFVPTTKSDLANVVYLVTYIYVVDNLYVTD